MKSHIGHDTAAGTYTLVMDREYAFALSCAAAAAVESLQKHAYHDYEKRAGSFLSDLEYDIDAAAERSRKT